MLPRSYAHRALRSLRTAPPISAARAPLRILPISQAPPSQRRHASSEVEIDPNVTDPNMNGGYPQLEPVKRQHRDPYADWWDKQERRNFGEPVHEDNDILGIFSTEDYRWTTPGWGGVLFGTFVLTFLGVVGVVYQFYPDTPTVPRRFPGGLERELGGKNAVPALSDADED